MGSSENLRMEFPRHMLSWIRCSRDSGELRVFGIPEEGDIGFLNATLRCASCAAEYVIVDGIARLLTPSLSAENQHEMALRDSEYERNAPGAFIPPSSGWRSEFSDSIEVAPHMDAMGELNRKKILELGCGDGRFTIPLAQMGAEILAIDFSLTGLYRLGAYVRSGIVPTTYRVTAPQRAAADVAPYIGMVQADAGNFSVAPQGFDRALSATPLDSRDERMKMYHSIADALKDDGHFIGGVEHDDFARRLIGEPLARRYTEGGVFIEHFDRATMQREAAPYFERISIRPIRPRIPFARQMPLALGVGMARMAAAMPGARELGEILLMRAERPVRPPAENAIRRGNWLAKSLYSWYRRRRVRDLAAKQSDSIKAGDQELSN
jgi:SAM-dependent methyltransferase